MKKLLILAVIVASLTAKILIVNSYDSKDQCGIPQLNGFLYVMYKHGYNPGDFNIVFLNSRVISKQELKNRAKKILNTINNYKTVVTIDDNAFKYVGIPALDKNKTVFFSGLNYPFEKYKKEYNLSKNIGGVIEKLYVKEMLTTFNKIIPINKIALFYSDGVGTILKNQILGELENSKFKSKIRLFHIKTVKELDEKTRLVDQNSSFTLFMPWTLSLKKENKKLPFYKIKDIYLNNLRKPDLSVNLTFVKMGFLGFGGVDFFEMGKQTGKIFLHYKKTGEFKIQNASKYYYFINAKRAKEIGLKLPKWFIKNYVKDIVW